MVSNTVFVLVTVALTAYLVDCQSVGSHDFKCKPKKEAMEEFFNVIVECCKETTGKTCDQKTFAEDMHELTEDQEDEMCKCVGLKQGVISADGQFDVEKAKESLNMLDVDAETKTALESNLDECVEDNKDDVDGIITCTRKGNEKICEA